MPVNPNNPMPSEGTLSRISDSDIHVDICNGRVVLSGVVYGLYMKFAAEEAARELFCGYGADAVVNELEVRPLGVMHD